MFDYAGQALARLPARESDLLLEPISYRQSLTAHPRPVLPESGRNPAQAVPKRMLDVAIAALMLVLLAPLMLLVAIAIRLDSPGPVLFRQRRTGLGERPFALLKFRTMYDHAPSDLDCRQATRGDPRITRVGHWLRCTSLDELPQLVNVLRGEMSMVGPRPHTPGTCAGGRRFEEVAPHYAARHAVRPGITGLAQVRGWRGETDTEEKLLRRIDCDLEYIATWSLRLDLLILCRTLVSVLGMRNAY